MGTEEADGLSQNVESAKSAASGKTFADVLDSILATPAKLFSLILIFAALGFIAFGLIFLFQKLIGVTPSEIHISPAGGTEVVFSTAVGNSKDYLVTVHPQGWQNTRIPINSGDGLTFVAGGSVNIDLEAILDNVKLRHGYEDEVKKAKKLSEGDRNDVPERYFDEVQKAKLKIKTPWVGPEGNKTNDFTSWAGRIQNRVLPDAPAGALVGAVSDPNGNPSRTEAFLIGRRNQHHADRGGELWVNVNDILNLTDPSNPNLFFF